MPGSPDYRAPTSAFIFSTSSAEFSFSRFSSSTVLASSFSKLSIICNDTQQSSATTHSNHLQQHTAIICNNTQQSSATTHSNHLQRHTAIICNDTQQSSATTRSNHLQQHTAIICNDTQQSSATTHSNHLQRHTAIICNDTQCFHSADQLLKAVNHLTQSMPHDLPNQPHSSWPTARTDTEAHAFYVY